ncbi:Dihydroxyacetone kinase 2 [Ceratobasidium sp. 414]|nr:Dihydroxyacetone kinase 2 [Ceratobasidium sp. 414]
MASLHKHIISSPASLVLDALHGVASANPNAAVDDQHKVIYIAQPDRSRVALISGGGAGHEPAHSGFVAAVCGDVFASPNANQVKRALQLVDNDKGCYTGDILNFGLAREQYCAANPSKANALKFVIVGDDVSVGKTQGEIVGRRGLAGTVLVYKIAGALANKGASLDQVHAVAQFVADRTGTIAVGLEHCHVPGAGPAESHLKHDEIEVGMGIHNEPGHSRVRPIPPLHTLVDKLLGYLFATTESDPEHAFLPWPKDKSTAKCVLLVNNLGGLSSLELGSVANAVLEKVREAGVSVERLLVGTYMTSLNMPGFSVTLVLLPSNDRGPAITDVILSLLDAPAKTPAWTWTSSSPPGSAKQLSPPSKSESANANEGGNKVSSRFVDAVRRACDALIRAEPNITQMDQIAGDGDCGTTLKAGAEAILGVLSDKSFTSSGVAGSIGKISAILSDAMGGTSGALYSIYLSALAQGLQNASAEPTRAEYASAATFALDRLYTYTRARPPSRTLVDPLEAFVKSLRDEDVGLDQAFAAAHLAAENTKNLPARAGRAAYVEAETVKGICDPGAWGVRCLLQGLFNKASYLAKDPSLACLKISSTLSGVPNEVQVTSRKRAREGADLPKAGSRPLFSGGFSIQTHHPPCTSPTKLAMHTVARTSSPSPMQHSYLSYHHAPPAAYAGTPQSFSTPGESLTPSYPFPPPTSPGFNASMPSYMGPRVEPAPRTPARGCLKPPTKEFATTPDAYLDPTVVPLPSKDGATASRRRPNMKLEHLPSAIARIQLAEGVEQLATSSGVAGKCKARVPTPYVKSDKDSWLSDADD